MAIKSKPFGGVQLSGKDADAFLRQVEAGPTDEQRRIISESIKRGRKMINEARPKKYAVGIIDPREWRRKGWGSFEERYETDNYFKACVVELFLSFRLMFDLHRQACIATLSDAALEDK